jgi:hypothetical protein
MYNFTMRHHFRRPQAMFLIMDHCSIVTVGHLDHTFWRGRAVKQQKNMAAEIPPPLQQATHAIVSQKRPKISMHRVLKAIFGL